MSVAWRRWWAVLAVAAAPAASAGAQQIPGGPPAMAGMPPAAGVPLVAGPGAGGFEPACTCGGGHGWGPWRRHHAACKRHLQRHFVGYPEEFWERPLGASVYTHARTQVANAHAARMILNEYDFVEGTDRLNVRGQDKLAWIASQLPITYFPVVVERTPETPALAESRRMAVLGLLAGGPFPVPAERVLVGPRGAYGLSGPEAVIVNANQLGQVAAGTGFTGGGVGAGAGAGTSGTAGGVGGFDATGLSGAAVAR